MAEAQAHAEETHRKRNAGGEQIAETHRKRNAGGAQIAETHRKRKAGGELIAEFTCHGDVSCGNRHGVHWRLAYMLQMILWVCQWPL